MKKKAELELFFTLNSLKIRQEEECQVVLQFNQKANCGLCFTDHNLPSR